MPTEFKLPDPGEGIHEAEIIKILVSEGDSVEDGQSVLEIETDKAAVEIPAPVTGTVKEIRVSEGDVVQEGDVLIVFREEGEAEEEKQGQAAEKPAAEEAPAEGEDVEAEQDRAEEKAQEAPGDRKQAGGEKEQEEEKPKHKKEQEEEKHPEAGKTADQQKGAEKQPSGDEKKAPREGPVPATPATRRLARELNVDLEQVAPSGRAGRVTAEDVQAHAEGKKPAAEKPAEEKRPSEKKPSEKKPSEEKPSEEKPAEEKKPAAAPAERPALPDFSQWGEVEEIPLRSVRRTTAKRMAQSWSQVPHVTHQDTADVTDLEAFRRQNKAELEGREGELTLTAFAIKAAVAALKAHPRFNSSLNFEAQKIILKKYFHIGVAVDTDRGLLVPVVRNADCKGMLDLAEEVFALAEKTRQGELEPKDMSGGTFTITNVGPLGGTGFTPIINYPQVAILGLARARLQPVIRGDLDNFEVVPRLMLPLCLAFDHRVADGADAARFMGEVIRLLEDPQKLMLV